MTYAAEPYAQFVDDLLSSLTGGTVREQFRFLPENAPYKLAATGGVLPRSVRVFGLSDAAYFRFRNPTDYTVGADQSIVWKAASDGTPAKDAVWPDEASAFFASYETADAVRLLTDRNTGSVTRLLAESFAREFAVLSRQLEAVYQAGFIETAGGRDLDQLALLVGIVRRRRLAAGGTVIFGRSTPAPADVTINAGTRLSTVEPPAATFETTEDRTLQRGNLTVEVPVQALEPGAGGVVAAGTIRAMNRPIFGIESVDNPQPTRFAGSDESDDALRARVRRAHEGAGKATTGALLSALTTLPGLRDKDIRIAEDYLAHPGVVRLTVALPEMSSEAERVAAIEKAVELIEATRPVGVRIEHNIDAPLPAGVATPGPGVVAEDGEEPVTVGIASAADGLFMPVDATVELTPATLALSPEARADLERKAREATDAFIDEAGIGEALVYNKLVASLMALTGVLDVAVEIFPQNAPGGPRRRNVVPDNPQVRPVTGVIDVRIGGALIMLDITVDFTLQGAGTLGDPATAREVARSEAATRLKDGFAALASGAKLTVPLLMSMVPDTATYKLTDLHYHAEYVDAGVRIHQQDVELPLSGLERLWIRRVALASAATS
ncbi:baseplate J/gp47 family protein [Variovorax rhizosphaerae]|uniref:Baseplate J/gp47 family protein n=1 Tax=Variovorax rhizosphaerae TaxID=1836200 RepID=A0ABU8WPR5_9BURK